jgi:hypothetical protein
MEYTNLRVFFFLEEEEYIKRLQVSTVRKWAEIANGKGVGVRHIVGEIENVRVK